MLRGSRELADVRQAEQEPAAEDVGAGGQRNSTEGWQTERVGQTGWNTG